MLLNHATGLYNYMYLLLQVAKCLFFFYFNNVNAFLVAFPLLGRLCRTTGELCCCKEPSGCCVASMSEVSLSPKANMFQQAMDSNKAALSLPIHVFCDIHKLSVKALPPEWEVCLIWGLPFLADDVVSSLQRARPQGCFTMRRKLIFDWENKSPSSEFVLIMLTKVD